MKLANMVDGKLTQWEREAVVAAYKHKRAGGAVQYVYKRLDGTPMAYFGVGLLGEVTKATWDGLDVTKPLAI